MLLPFYVQLISRWGMLYGLHKALICPIRAASHTEQARFSPMHISKLYKLFIEGSWADKCFWLYLLCMMVATLRVNGANHFWMLCKEAVTSSQSIRKWWRSKVWGRPSIFSQQQVYNRDTVLTLLSLESQYPPSDTLGSRKFGQDLWVQRPANDLT